MADAEPSPATLRCAEIANPGEPLVITTRPLPPVPAKGASIFTLYAGVCHSDVHFLDDDLDMGDGKKFKIRDTEHGEKLKGMVLGHEIMGIIDQFGAESIPEEHGLSVGDTVVIYPWIGCSNCPSCKAGNTNICEKSVCGLGDIGQDVHYMGGYSTYVRVPDLKFAVKLPAAIPRHTACLLPCSALTTYCALKKVRESLQLGMEIHNTPQLLVSGVGGLGLWCIKLAKIMYPGIRVACIDVSEEKLQTAHRNGSDVEYLCDHDMTQEDMINRVTLNGEQKSHAAIDLVGSEQSATLCLHSLHRSGTVVLIGLRGGKMSFPIPSMITKAPSIRGSRTGTVSELRTLLDLLAEHKVTYPDVSYYGLDDLNAVLCNLRDGNMQGRGILKHNSHLHV